MLLLLLSPRPPRARAAGAPGPVWAPPRPLAPRAAAPPPQQAPPPAPRKPRPTWQPGGSRGRGWRGQSRSVPEASTATPPPAAASPPPRGDSEGSSFGVPAKPGPLWVWDCETLSRRILLHHRYQKQSEISAVGTEGLSRLLIWRFWWTQRRFSFSLSGRSTP